jgi:hypothetical protein
VQPTALHRNVHAAVRGLAGQVGTELPGIGTRHVQLDARRVPGGKPADAVDVRTAGGDPARDRRHIIGIQRAPDERHVQGATAPRQRLRGARRHLDLQPEIGGHLGHGTVDRGEIGELGTGNQHAEDQAAPYDHLLNILNAERKPSENPEKPGGHPWPVPAGERDQQRGPRFVHRESTLPGNASSR